MQMTPELTYLVWSVVLLLAHLTVMSVFKTADIGIAKGLGPRDGDASPDGVIAPRLIRAFDNYLETWPAFIALALVLAVAGAGTAISALGAAVWFWARVVYVPIYAAGIPGVRTLVWLVSLVGLVMMLWPLLLTMLS